MGTVTGATDPAFHQQRWADYTVEAASRDSFKSLNQERILALPILPIWAPCTFPPFSVAHPLPSNFLLAQPAAPTVPSWPRGGGEG